jgi:hypothetical protein
MSKPAQCYAILVDRIGPRMVFGRHVRDKYLYYIRTPTPTRDPWHGGLIFVATTDPELDTALMIVRPRQGQHQHWYDLVEELPEEWGDYE